MTDREFVEQHWERVWWDSDYDRGTRLRLWSAEFDVKNSVGDPELYLTPELESAIYAAAAEFTRERLEEVMQIREEITETARCIGRHDEQRREDAQAGNDVLALDSAETVAIHRRILSRLQRELDSLKKGMKEAQ